MNSVLKIYEDGGPFARFTGACTLNGNDIICDRTGGYVIQGLAITPELKQALEKKLPEGKQVTIILIDDKGNAFPAIIGTTPAH